MSRREAVLRGLMSLAFVVGAGLLIAVQWQIRHVEAEFSASVLQRLFRVDAVVNTERPVFYFETPTPHSQVSTVWTGLSLTAECTVAWLIAPLLALCGLIVLGPRLRVRAVLVAVGLTAVALVAVNVLRVVVIALATHKWGVDVGYRWSHDVYGSMVTVVGVGVAILLFLRLATRFSRGDLAATPAGRQLAG